MLPEENTTSLYQVEEMPGMTVKSSWKLCLILLGWLFTYNHSLLAQSIEWSRSPAYLTPAQVHDDLVAAKQLIRENYVHYERLQQAGHDWDQVFSELRSQLLENPRPMLTQHFQEKLLDALQFTEDPVFRADLHLPRRHYQTRIPLVEPRFTDLRLAKQGDRFRVLPDQKFPGLANLWLNECDHPSVRLFPILPERIREERVMLGIYASEFPERIRCEFVDELNRKVTRELLLQRIVKELVSPRQTLFQADEGRVFYVRWLRDGRKEETAVRDFYLLPERMGSARTLILDVRDNAQGSFSFIERWLRDVLRNNVQSCIVREKQTPATIIGLLRQMEWQERQLSQSGWLQDALAQQRGVFASMLQRFEEESIETKWMETKFLFQGKPKSPKWNKRLIVIANDRCGPGCQFVVGLSRQLPNATLLGTNTGPYPDGNIVPMFQLPASGILLSLSHQFHLDHQLNVVRPSGQEPDFWLFPTTTLSSVMRFANSELEP